MTVGIDDHPHHGEPWCHVLQVLEAIQRSDPLSERFTEDCAIQNRRNDRWRECMAPEAHNDATLAKDQGLQANPTCASGSISTKVHQNTPQASAAGCFAAGRT